MSANTDGMSSQRPKIVQLESPDPIQIAVPGIPADRKILISTALSIYVCSHKSPLVNGTYTICTVLGKLAPLQASGQPPLDDRTDWASTPRPYASRALERHGVTGETVRYEWRKAKSTYGSGVTLDAGLLLRLVPPPYWRVLNGIIDDGPATAVARVEALLMREAERCVKPNRKRPKGGVVSQAHLDALAGEVGRLFRVLVDLKGRDHPISHGHLDKWSTLPKIDRKAGASGDVTDTTAPPLSLLREAYGALERDLELVTGVKRPDQADAIRTMLTTKRQTRLFYRLRARAMLGLLATVGMRVGALSALDIGDVVRAHQLPDGRTSPALALRPGKTIDSTEVRFKPIPVELLHVVDAFVAYRETMLGVTLPSDEPLLSPTVRDLGRRWSGRRISMTLSTGCMVANRSNDSGKTATGPLLPKDGGEVGYSAHTIRSAVTQMVRSQQAAEWIEAHRAELFNRVTTADGVLQIMIAEALTDHSASLDLLGYGGGKKGRDREMLSYIGTMVTWELLAGDLGAQKVHDEASLRSTLHKMAALEAEIKRVREESDQCNPLKPTQSEAIAALLRLQQLTGELERLQEEMRATEAELDDLKHNPKRLVSVPDGEVAEQVDVAALEREVFDGKLADDRRRSKNVAVRDWITGPELAEISGASVATVRRWMNGTFPRRIKPWDPGNPPIDESLGARRRRLVVAGLNPALFDTQEKRERLAQLQAREPEGWSQAQINAPLQT